MKEKPNKILKRISKEREREWTPSTDPERPYKRVTIRTRLWWPTALAYEGRWDVLLVMIIIYVLAGAAIIAGLYFVIKFLIDTFMGLIP